MKNRKHNSCLFMILFAAMIMITMPGCSKKSNGTATPTSQAVQSTDTPAPSNTPAPTDTPAPIDNEVRFKFVVVDRDGKETSFDITTGKETVGEALLDEKLIEGDVGEYGLYVKKVNGIEAVYENDGTYWAFYINGEYATSGVDSTKAESGVTYMFKVES